MQFLKNRKMRKLARETLRHSHHLVNMREDVMQEAELTELRAKQGCLEAALKTGEHDRIGEAADDLYASLKQSTPRRRLPGLRENLEIAVVAISVAMAFRTYFIQPFKIPTGSMQPTLYGIQTHDQDAPGITDRLPLKLAKWLIFGDWYTEIRAKTSGYVRQDESGRSNTDPSYIFFYIGSKRHKVPKTADVRLTVGDYITKGTVLWKGVRTVGDHVFVDKVRWNFMPPRRGDIVVFNTDDIEGLPPRTHYIKRMVGLPGETLSIDPPNLIVDGQKVVEPRSIARIAGREPGYEAGYTLVSPRSQGYYGTILKRPSDRIALREREYFALGDNTENSRDGRYWGAVPQKNLVGPALLVYWPASTRWGLAR